MIPFAGTVYRNVFADQDPTLPVASPEGRFHHDGQCAIYTSLTPEGSRVAIKRYVTDQDRPRVIVQLAVNLTQVADMRGKPALSIVWQDIRATGQAAPTWAFSDQARAQGAHGLLYSSRSRPDLTHLVLFTADPAFVTLGGSAMHAPIPD